MATNLTTHTTAALSGGSDQDPGSSATQDGGTINDSADNDGPSTSSGQASLEQTGWVSSADGIVVHDLNGDGKINNISETLSEYYNGQAGSNGMAGTKPYANGFAALKRLDGNAISLTAMSQSVEVRGAQNANQYRNAA